LSGRKKNHGWISMETTLGFSILRPLKTRSGTPHISHAPHAIWITAWLAFHRVTSRFLPRHRQDEQAPPMPLRSKRVAAEKKLTRKEQGGADIWNLGLGCGAGACCLGLGLGFGSPVLEKKGTWRVRGMAGGGDLRRVGCQGDAVAVPGVGGGSRRGNRSEKRKAGAWWRW
jgi:hypothetical protein